MKYKETSMSNVLSHAITETIHLGKKGGKEDFHIALTGTADKAGGTKFFDFLKTPEAKAIFEKYGFTLF